MTSDEEDREVLTFEDVAKKMYSTEVTQQWSGYSLLMIGKRGL